VTDISGRSALEQSLSVEERRAKETTDDRKYRGIAIVTFHRSVSIVRPRLEARRKCDFAECIRVSGASLRSLSRTKVILSILDRVDSLTR